MDRHDFDFLGLKLDSVTLGRVYEALLVFLVIKWSIDSGLISLQDLQKLLQEQ